MRLTRTATGTLATAIALLVLPAAAPAEYLVPPSNSAATQYTETVPTSGGGRDSEKGGKDRSPREVLGERNTEKLHEHGEAGRKVAEVVATTAPAPAPAPEPAPVEGEPAPAPERGDGEQPPEEKQREGLGEAVAVAAASGGGPGPTAPQASGSSGIGEILAQATGVSSAGQLGLLLPLAIALTAAWALAFLLRQRRQPTP